MYKGMVKSGHVVLESGVELPDGAEVRVVLAAGPGPSVESRALQENMWQVLRSLPDGVSLEDVLEEVYLLYKIERGVRQLDAGQGVPHEEARERFRQWLE